MEKKSLEFSMEDVMHLAQSPAARQLMEVLRAKDTAALDRAIANAASGDFAQAQQDLAALLADPALASLLRQLGG